MKGIIKKLTDRGFGFIGEVDQNGQPMADKKDLFFHSKSLVGVMFDDLREGEMVTFDVENSPKGPSAVNVQRAPAAAPAMA